MPTQDEQQTPPNAGESESESLLGPSPDEADGLSGTQRLAPSSQQLRSGRLQFDQEEEKWEDPMQIAPKGNASVTTPPQPPIRKCEAGNVFWRMSSRPR